MLHRKKDKIMVELNINLKNIQKSVLENNKIKSGTMDLSKELDSMIAKLKERVTREIPDTGYFRNFAINLEKGKKPDFFASDIALFVEKDEMKDGNAFLGVSVLHPTMCLDATTYLMDGNRNKILEYINNKDFKSEIQKNILELAESLKNQ